MALSRRTGQRFQASIWPGFVDAITALLLVLIFILTIFMAVQFVLRDTISGQESKLDQLSQQVESLAEALGLERVRNRELDEEVGLLTASLENERLLVGEQTALIAALRAQSITQLQALEGERARITEFEAQVAGLIAERDGALQAGEALRADIADLQAARSRLISEQEALQIVLAQARDEIDAGAEVARLAAARREALEALIVDLRRQGEEAAGQNAALQESLSEAEAARLADAAAAEALRERLRNADAELVAMTLVLEEERARAEETLTLLAAAEAAGKDLTARLAAALLAQEVAASGREEAAKALEAAIARITVLEGETADRQEVEARLAEALVEALAEKLLIEGQMVAQAASVAPMRTELQAIRVERDQLNAQLTALRGESEKLAGELVRKDLSLAEALAARLLLETAGNEALSEAQRRAALLATAEVALSEEQAISAERQRRVALLNGQVAELRSQLGALRALLDEAKERDEAANVQIENLGADLNTALARAAAEERQRRILEEEERRRLEAEAQSLQSRAEDLERYRSEFFGLLREVLGGQDGVRIEGDRFVFSSEVLFPPAEVELSDSGKSDVAEVAKIIERVADQIPPHINWVIRVDGHTDDLPLSGDGRYSDNWELSQGRALSVVRYMIDELGIPPHRLAAAGFGEYQPVNTGNSDEARTQNRRIELKFTER